VSDNAKLSHSAGKASWLKLLMDGVTERFGVFFRALRVLRRIAIWGSLALLALILGALAINAFDERPSPEALELLHPPENRYRPDDNLYVSLAGFDAPASQSVISVGQARIAHYNERVDTMLRDPLVGLEMLAGSDPQRLKFEGSIDCCRPREASFWGGVHANGLKIDQLIDQNRELYQRYLALFDLPGYYETARPSPAAPIYMVPTDVRNLFLANVSLRMQSGDELQIQSALKSIRQDIDLWHRMLIGEGTLISKMLAVAFLQTDSLILADMIADPRVAIPQNMDEYLPQFDLSDWNIRNAFAVEFRLHTFIYRQTQALTDNHWQPPDSSSAWRMWNRILSPIESCFFKINATENLDAKVMSELGAFAALAPPTFATDQAQLKKWEQKNADFMSIRTIYNPIGKILVAIAAPAYENYIVRPYDAAALQRLVRLSFEIRRQRIAPSEITGFMKRHPEWATHPADGRSFVWKPSSGEIAIQPVAQQSADRRFSVQIWKGSAG
jgi:hypothetical protein